MSNSSDSDHGERGGAPPAKPILNDQRPEEGAEAQKQAEAVRQDTGGAIDADAAHDRSS